MRITSWRLGKNALIWVCLSWLSAISGAFAQNVDTLSNNLDTLSKQIVERDEKRLDQIGPEGGTLCNNLGTVSKEIVERGEKRLDQIGQDREDSTAIFYQKLKQRLY